MSLNPDTSSVKHQSDLSYATSASAAILYQSPKGGKLLLWSIIVFLVAMLVWAWHAQLDEFTRGEGRVIPSSSVQLVQNLEGGIVAEVFVKEGQLVKQGEPLLQLEAIRFTASLRESQVNKAQLLVRSQRLSAEAEGKDFITDNFDDEIAKEIISSEKALFLARQEELKSNVNVLEQQKVQKDQELSELNAKVKQLDRSFRLLQNELSITEPLVAQGAVSQVELLRLQRQVNDLRGERNAAQLSIPRVQSSLAELSDRINAEESAFRSQARAEFADIQSELARLVESSQAIVDQVDRTLIRSPVNGVIKQLFVRTLGGVVQPGRDMVAIVPSDDRLLIETKIRPADIAFLHPQQRATVKFTAYDFAVHGGLEGRVVTISPDTIVDDEGNSFYLVQIETERSFLGEAANPLPIIAGMTVNTDILTGKKSVLDYLLKPILKTKELALRER